MPVKFIRVFFAILVASSLQAQTSSHTWAHLIRDLAFGRAVAVDANGNSYFTGYYYQTVTIGSTVLTNKGAADIYLAKFDATGNPLWARSAGGSGYDVPSRNAVDAAGNCYLTGSFNGSAAFGSRTISSAGATDGFVAKYDTAGECAWVVAIGGRYADEVRGVTTDARGNCYVTGTFGDAFILSNGQLISSSGGTDFFIVKISPAGTILWAAQGGGSGDDAGVGVTVDARGAVYVTGNFTASMRIGSTVLTPDGTDNTASDMFIAKYDSMGTPLWAHQSKGRAYVRGISTDASGNSTVTGSIDRNTSFGQFRLTGSGNDNAFVARYDAKGTCRWASVSSGTNSSARSYDVKTDVRGNAIIMGDYIGKAKFDSIEITSFNNLQYDLFICTYDSLGRCVGARSMGGPSIDYAGGVAVDNNGTAYVTGTCDQSGTFGYNTVTGTGAFIATLSDDVLGVDDYTKDFQGFPTTFRLEQNYPNPFNPSTTISFSLPSQSFVTLRIYDVMGREVTSLISEEMQAGSYSKRWNASGKSSGIYFYRLQAGAYMETKRMLILY